MRFDADFSVTGWLTSAAFCMTTLRVVDVGSLTLIPPVWVWMNTWRPAGLGGGPDGVEVPRVVGLGRGRRQEDGPEPECGGALDLHDGIVHVGQRDGGGRRQPGEVGPEPLDDVVVVDPGMADRQLVVVGVEAEQRQVRVHDPDIDAVGVEVLQNDFGVALGHPAARLAVARNGPPLEAGRVQPAELGGAALHERIDLEVVLPDAAVPQILREAGHEEVGGFEDVPVSGDDKLVRCHGCALPARGRKIDDRARRVRGTLSTDSRPTGRYRQRRRTGAAVGAARRR